MAAFNWQTDIVNHRYEYDASNRWPLRAGEVPYKRQRSYMVEDGMYCMGLWTECEILVTLNLLSDEELKICMLHQPQLVELVAEILATREKRK